MQFIPLLVFVIVCGIIMALLERFVPIAEPFRTIAVIMVVLIFIVWLWNIVSGMGLIPHMK